MINTKNTVIVRSYQKNIPIVVKKKGKLNKKVICEQAPVYY